MFEVVCSWGTYELFAFIYSVDYLLLRNAVRLAGTQVSERRSCRERLSRLKQDWWNSVFPRKSETNNQTWTEREVSCCWWWVDCEEDRSTGGQQERTDNEWQRQVLRGGLTLTKALCRVQETQTHIQVCHWENFVQLIDYLCQRHPCVPFHLHQNPWIYLFRLKCFRY